MSDAPIAIFDSGVGGLTVASAIAKHLPNEQLVYLGDTARLPYGTKSAETVTRYAVQATRALMRFQPKLIVVACNTASAVALPVLTAAYAPIPVIGVVEPGARAAVTASKSGNIAVIATEGTVRGGAYVRAIHALKPEARIVQRACPLFVSLAEEGWTDGPVPELAAERYLKEIFTSGERPDTLVLGCTHFPVLVTPIAKAVGNNVALVDSAATTAREVETLLDARNLRRQALPKPPSFLGTDAPDRFARVGSLFFGQPIAPAQVELIDLTP
ncbi:MAG: glutamate racemase [Alphaproteobacteria bacterium]|nr:glutamate racemase [Alphaproteobacteria bacterium]